MKLVLVYIVMLWSNMLVFSQESMSGFVSHYIDVLADTSCYNTVWSFTKQGRHTIKHIEKVYESDNKVKFIRRYNGKKGRKEEAVSYTVYTYDSIGRLFKELTVTRSKGAMDSLEHVYLYGSDGALKKSFQNLQRKIQQRFILVI